MFFYRTFSSRQGYPAPSMPNMRSPVLVQNKSQAAHAGAHQAETSNLCRLRERHHPAGQSQKAHEDGPRADPGEGFTPQEL